MLMFIVNANLFKYSCYSNFKCARLSPPHRAGLQPKSRIALSQFASATRHDNSSSHITVTRCSACRGGSHRLRQLQTLQVSRKKAQERYSADFAHFIVTNRNVLKYDNNQKCRIRRAPPRFDSTTLRATSARLVELDEAEEAVEGKEAFETDESEDEDEFADLDDDKLGG